MARYWNPDDPSEPPGYYPFVQQLPMLEEACYEPDVAYEPQYRQYAIQASTSETFSLLPGRKRLDRIYAPPYIVNRYQPRRLVQSLIPPHHVGPTMIRPRQQQRMQLPHQQPIRLPFGPYPVRSRLQENRQQRESVTYTRGPLSAPWPHDRCFKKPFTKPNIPQTIHLNEYREVRWFFPACQNRLNQQGRDQDIQNVTARFSEVASNPIHYSRGICDDVYRSESASNSEHNTSEREISSSSKDTDSNNSVKPSVARFRNNASNLPIVTRVITLFGDTPEPFIRPLDILMKLYFIIYQCYAPTDFYINYEEHLLKLSKQIWETYLSHQLSINEYTSKLLIWKKLQLLLNKERPEFEYKLFLTGSTLSGLSLSGGDMDLCVKGESRPGIPDRHNSMFHLESIKRVLESVKEIEHLQIIEAKVPLLRFSVIGNTRITIDMNCNNVVAIANTQFLYAYTKCDWRLQPLNSLIKQWAIYNNINDPWKKTLSSYTITLLIIQFLQCGIHPAVLPCLHHRIDESCWKDIADHDPLEIFNYWVVEYKSTNKSSLGQLFIDFFKFYADLDFTKYVISVRTGSPIKRSVYKYLYPNVQFKETNFIVVEEPFTKSNTAYSVHCPVLFDSIKQIFRETRDNLTNSKILEGIFK